MVQRGQWVRREKPCPTIIIQKWGRDRSKKEEEEDVQAFIIIIILLKGDESKG